MGSSGPAGWAMATPDAAQTPKKIAMVLILNNFLDRSASKPLKSSQNSLRFVRPLEPKEGAGALAVVAEGPYKTPMLCMRAGQLI